MGSIFLTNWSLYGYLGSLYSSGSVRRLTLKVYEEIICCYQEHSLKNLMLVIHTKKTKLPNFKLGMRISPAPDTQTTSAWSSWCGGAATLQYVGQLWLRRWISNVCWSVPEAFEPRDVDATNVNMWLIFCTRKFEVAFVRSFPITSHLQLTPNFRELS